LEKFSLPLGQRGRAVLPSLSVREAGVRVVFERSTTKTEAEQFSPLSQ